MFLVFTVPCSHCRKRCYDNDSRRHGSINEACHCGRSHRERRIIMTSKIIDLSYTIKKYRELKDTTFEPNNLLDVWNFLRNEQIIDANGQLINKDGDK